MPATCSRNHGSIAVDAASSATLAPARSACWTTVSRASRGSPACATSAARSSPAGSPRQWNTDSGRSSERSAFCSASANERPMAIASPTLFIVVVRVGSACGNFSNANRGTFTTM